MPAMRITSGHMSRHWLQSVQSIQSGVASLSQQVASGSRISRPSDDPTATVRSLAVGDRLERYEQFSRNVQFAQGHIEVAEGGLADVTAILHRVRELLIQGGNDTNSPEALEAIAQEVRQLKEGIRQAANLRYGDDYVFAGTATGTRPYPGPGNAYAGNGNAMERRVDDGVTVVVNRPGTTVFGVTTGALPTDMDVFDLLDQVVADLQAGTPAARDQIRGANLQALDGHLDNVLRQRAELGAVSNRLDRVAERLSMLREHTTEDLSRLRDTDMAEAIMRLTTLNTVYEAALMSGSRMLQTSLVDFLR